MAGMWFWWLFGIILLVGFAWLITRQAPGAAAGREDSAEETLKKRYARGEIDHDEYEQRLQDLRK